MNLYKEVENYSDYIIFKTGKIFSKKRNRFMKLTKKKHKLQDRIDMRIALCKNGKEKKFYLARLLGIHFIPNPLNKPQIDHIDRNSLNNDLSNLRWVNRSENTLNRKLQKSNKLGLRYIHKTKSNSYKVKIERHKYQKHFKTEEEAILQRNCFLDFMGEDYLNIDV